MPKPPPLADLLQNLLQRASNNVPTTEVEPHEVGSAFMVDPQAAWDETILVLKIAGLTGPAPTMPATWSKDVQTRKPVAWLPMAPGHYPQQVSQLTDFTTLKVTTTGDSSFFTALTKSSSILQRLETGLSGWCAGRLADAESNWQALPDSALRHFNLGLVKLMQQEQLPAIEHFQRAKLSLPKESGWHALAELYGSLAETGSPTD